MLTDWLMVIITFVYVIATIFICIFNSKSARAAKEQSEIAQKQIDLMIQQFNESNRPMISIRFDIIRSGVLCFVIENTGLVAARNVTIRLNEDFIKNVEKYEPQSNIKAINESDLYLVPRQKMVIFIAGQPQFSKIAEVVAKFDVSYSEKYKEHIEIDIDKYGYMLVYNGELGDISQCLKRTREENKKYHDNLIREMKKHPPISVISIEKDGSLRSRTFRTVCINPGINAEQIGEILEIDKEDVLPVLEELEKVDHLIEQTYYDEDNYKIRWRRKE